MSAEVKRATDADVALKPSSLSLAATAGGGGGGCSGASSPADTPGDSGVLCLDSESELTSSAALMTASLAGAEELACDTAAALMTRSDIDNRNVGVGNDAGPELLVETPVSQVYDNLPDVVLKALESEKAGPRAKCMSQDGERHTPRIGEPKKSQSEDIVFRRKCKKKSQGLPGAQKKRVSFHEDILKNTKTDNIHIEHGFISYSPGGSYCDRFRHNNPSNERFSWCASGDKVNPKVETDIGQQTMSDILGYSCNDKSGVFEYSSPSHEANADKCTSSRNNSFDNETGIKRELYGCESNSSDSNLSCQSETSSSDSSSSNSHDNCTRSQKCDKTQKSYSCDCFENDPQRTFMRKMYFSEADIDQDSQIKERQRQLQMDQEISHSPGTVKSVLKKKRYIPTNIVEEHKKEIKKGLLPHNNIFDSFKNFYKTFNFNLSPEKGLAEGTEDSTTVIEAVPCEVKSRSQFLSKSLDSGFHMDDEDEFVEINLHEQPSQNEITINFAQTPDNVDICSNKKSINLSSDESPRQRLTLNMNARGDQRASGIPQSSAEIFPDATKYVLNGESTVYEHKGVSYCYMHDSFQTEFDTPRELFIPIPEQIELVTPQITVQSPPKSFVQETDASAENDISENSESNLLPKMQYNKSVQEETDSKSVSKHLASPKKQNVNRYGYKSASTSRRTEDINCNITETCSNGDNSTLKGVDDGIDDVDVPPDLNFQREPSNKSSLLNRYLKNVCQKKDLELKIRNNTFFQKKLMLEKKFPNIIYPWNKVTKDFQTAAARVSRLIDKEIMENKRVSIRLLTASEPSYFDSFEDNVAMECSEKLRLQIFTQPCETLHRMLKVRSPYKMEDGLWVPLLAFITDYALYVAEVQPGRTEYNIVCRLPHHQLDAIAMGPECQYVQVLGPGGRVACTLVTGEAALAARLACSLEWAARTSPRPPRRAPAALPLSAATLAARIAAHRHTENTGLWFYGRACSGEACGAEEGSPAARPPQCDGYLMYKQDPRRRWEPSYFVLKAGSLQWGAHSPESAGVRLPHRVPLRSVLGVRRHCDPSRRPHCFEVALADGARMLLAAPDEPTASAWLQALLLHAAQALHDDKAGGEGGGAGAARVPAACSLLVTATEVLSVRESPDATFVAGAARYLHREGAHTLLREYVSSMRTAVEVLACGSIRDLTAFRIPDNDDNWCVLEWSVCEARERERGAALALVFASGGELERFISAVEHAYCTLTSSPFPLSVSDGEGSACGAAHARYAAAWAHMLPAH